MSIDLWGFLLDVILILQNLKIFLIHINIDAVSCLESRSFQIDEFNAFPMSRSA